MNSHLDTGLTGWSGKTVLLPEQGSMHRPVGSFQRYLDKNSGDGLPLLNGTLAPSAIQSEKLARQESTSAGGAREQIAPMIESAAAANGLGPKLLEAVVRTESGFDSQAVSPVGAQGLMQLMPGTASALGVTDAFDPEQNIQAGSRYLKQLMNRYGGDTSLALAAYNWGMGNLERHPERMPQETVNYVAKITGLMNRPV